MKKITRIVIYSRKSRYTDKGDSVGNQIEFAKQYIKSHYPEDEYMVQIKIFEDEGFSGKDTDRPQYQEMLKLVKKKEFDILICYRLDRISRNVSNFSSLIDLLNKHNITFISIKESFDTSTPMGKAMMYIAAVFAQLEREVIAERVRDNLLELAKTGIWLGGDPPLGFSPEKVKRINISENDKKQIKRKSKTATKLIVNDKEISTLKLIFYKYLELKSLSKLESYLMNNNIKSRKGVYYSVFALKWILTNPAYLQNDTFAKKYFESKGMSVYAENDGREKYNGKYGFLTYNKTSNKKYVPNEYWIVAVGLHPGIIPSKDWIAVQLLLKKNSDKRYRAIGYPKKQSIVSGLIKCKCCNSFMRPKNTDKRRSDGTVNYSYCCVLKEKSRGQKCNSKNIVGEKLDNKIIDIIKQISVPTSDIYQELKNMTIRKEKIDGKNEVELLQNELQAKENEINRIVEKLQFIDVDLIDVVNVNLRRLKEEKQEIINKIEKLSSKSVNINNTKKLNISEKNILKILDNSYQIFDYYDLKTKKDIANLFIENIYGGTGPEVEINLLNTKIDENQKRLFIPSFQNINNFFSKVNLSTDKVCINSH